MDRIPGTFSTKKASHDPDLVYQIADEAGKVETFYLEHEAGPRRQRRYRQRHHPYFTKTHTSSREWYILRKANRLSEKNGN